MRWLLWFIVGLLWSCAAAPSHPAPLSTEESTVTPALPRAEPKTDHARIAWSSLRSEIETLMCIRTLDVPDRGTIEIPSYGDRAACDLDPAKTPVQRSVEAAYEAAHGVLISLRAERDAAFAAMELEEPEQRLAAVRRGYMTDAFLGVLLPRLHTALAAEGLRCDGCPKAVHPPRREVTWSSFEPYLLAHVWPDPVTTPRDENGGRNGKPKISVHICGGINGVGELAESDPILVRAGYLAAFHTRAVHERVQEFLRTVAKRPAFDKLRSDDARTAYLREQIGPWLLDDPDVRDGVCQTLVRFEIDTGVVVTDCG